MSVSAFPGVAAAAEPAPAGLGRRLGLVAADPGGDAARAALAYARNEARRGSRVVIVEADGSRPRLARLCGVPASPGLADVLAGSAGPREAVHRGPAGIACLPFGEPRRGSENPDEPGLPAILDLLAQRYDRVLVACPPASDPGLAACVAGCRDGFIVVVGAERTRRRAAERAVSDLAAAGVTLIGTILQDCPRPLPGWVERWLP